MRDKPHNRLLKSISNPAIVCIALCLSTVALSCLTDFAAGRPENPEPQQSEAVLSTGDTVWDAGNIDPTAFSSLNLIDTVAPEYVEIEEERSYAENVKQLFREFPEKYLTVLRAPMREKMLTYLESDSLIHIYNTWYGRSWINEYKPNYLDLHLTDVSSLKIKQLDYKKDANLFVAIYTIEGEDIAPDSQILFFLSDKDGLREVDAAKHFKTPEPKTFWRVPDNRDEREALKYLLDNVPFYAVKYDISPDSGTLTATVTETTSLPAELREKLIPCLIKNHTWTWDGKKFKPLK